MISTRVAQDPLLGLAAAEDGRAREELPAQARPLAPHRVPVFGPLRLDEVLQHEPGRDDVAHPVAQRAVVFDVGGGSVARPPRRRACGRSRTAAPRVRSPRGRRRTSSASGGSPRTPSARRAGAPAPPRASPGRARPRTARRRTPSTPRRTTRPETAAGWRRLARAARLRPVARPSAAAWPSMPAERSSATGRAPARTSHREHGAEPAPTSSTRHPATSPSSRASCSRSPSGHQTKSTSPMSAPCSAR